MLEPGIKGCYGFLVDHRVDRADDIPCFGERGDGLLDRRDRDAFGFGESVTPSGHQAGDGARGGDPTQSFRFLARLWRSPFGDHTQRSAEAFASQTAPELGTVAMSPRPMGVEPGQVAFKRAFANAEHVQALAAQHGADTPAAVSRPAQDLLDRETGSGMLDDARTRSCPGRGQGFQSRRPL